MTCPCMCVACTASYKPRPDRCPTWQAFDEPATTAEWARYAAAPLAQVLLAGAIMGTAGWAVALLAEAAAVAVGSRADAAWLLPAAFALFGLLQARARRASLGALHPACCALTTHVVPAGRWWKPTGCLHGHVTMSLFRAMPARPPGTNCPWRHLSAMHPLQ